MPEARYLRKVISGMPVMAVPAAIDIATAEQLRTVLLHSAARRHATVVVAAADGAVSRVTYLTCLEAPVSRRGGQVVTAR